MQAVFLDLYTKCLSSDAWRWSTVGKERESRQEARGQGRREREGQEEDEGRSIEERGWGWREGTKWWGYGCSAYNWRIYASYMRTPFNYDWCKFASWKWSAKKIAYSQLTLHLSTRHSMPFHMVVSESDWDICFERAKTALQTCDWTQQLWPLY